MHMTLETDYAVRIMETLTREGKRVDARTISEKTRVPQRFALKILRSLVADGLVRSYKGASGGYELAPDASSSVTQIVKADETEDDPVEPVTFSFTNVPDDSLIGGNGVINNIAPDGNGGWDWTQITESGSTTGEVME